MADPTARGGKRVKWYVLNSSGKWDDRGTGHVRCKNSASVLQIHFQHEDSSGSGMVITVQNDTDYHLQGKTIISWTDKSPDPQVSLEMALSFAEPSGCSEVWDRICLAQSPTATANSTNYDEFLKSSSRTGSSTRPALVNSDEDPKAPKVHENADSHWSTGDVSDDAFTDSANMMMLAASASPFVASSAAQDGFSAKFVMPTPDKDGLNDLFRTLTDPTLIQKNALRERILAELSAGNYVPRLCALFSRSEKEGDVETLSKLYSIMRSICMFGNHPVIEALANQANILEVVGCLEYDPVSIANLNYPVANGQLQETKFLNATVCDDTESKEMDTTTTTSEVEKAVPKTDAETDGENSERYITSAAGRSSSEGQGSPLAKDENSISKAIEDSGFSEQTVSSCLKRTEQDRNPPDINVQHEERSEHGSPNLSNANPLQQPGTPRPSGPHASRSSSDAPRCPGTPRPNGPLRPFGPGSVVPEFPGTPQPAVIASNSAAPIMSSTPRPDVSPMEDANDGEFQRATPLSSSPEVCQMPGTPRPGLLIDKETGNSELHSASRHAARPVQKSHFVADSPPGNSSESEPLDSHSSQSVTVKDASRNPSKDEFLSSNGIDKASELNDAPKMYRKFCPLRKHRDFLESKVSFKAVAKISNPDVVTKIHQNFQVAYVKDVVLGRAMDDCYNNTLGTLVSCNNVDILLYFLKNSVSIRDLYRKVERLFKLRSKKRIASENMERPKSPKRPRFSSSSSSKESNESARSVQQVPGDDACPMETDDASGDNIAVPEKGNSHALPSAVIVQEISDAISFSIQLCEVSRSQGALRPQFYAMLRSCGALDVCLLALKDKLASIRLLGSNFLSIIAMQDYSELRTYITNTVKYVNDDAGTRKFCPRVPSMNTGGIHLRSVRTPLVSQLPKTPSSSVVGTSKSTEASEVVQISAASSVENVTQNCSSKTVECEQSKSVSVDPRPMEHSSPTVCPKLPVSVPDNRIGLKCSESNIEDNTRAAQACTDDKTRSCAQETMPSRLSVTSSVASEISSRQVKQSRDEFSNRRSVNQVSSNVKCLPRCEANRMYPLMATIVDVVCNDEEIGVVLQLIDLLRGLLDPTTMRVDVTRDIFVGIFYSHFADRLLEPIVRAGIRGKDMSDKRKAGQDENVPYLCDFLSYCVANHSFIVKYFVLSQDVGGKVTKLLRHSKKYIRLSGLRFLRTCIAMRDKAYDDYLLRHNLLQPVMEMYRENSHGDNLISSAVLDLVDYLTRASRKVLLEAVVEKFSDILEPSKVLCSTFEMAKAALRNTKTDRVNGSGPLASDTSLINELALAADGRLELNGVDQMVSILTSQADNNVPFEPSSGRMNMFGNDLRLPTMETGDAGFPVSDELYSSFPDLLGEKDATGPLAMGASDMWLENNTVEPGLHENQGPSPTREELSADSDSVREKHDDPEQRKSGDKQVPNLEGAEQASTQVDTKSGSSKSVEMNGYAPSHLRAQEHSSLQGVPNKLTVQSQKEPVSAKNPGECSETVERGDYESTKSAIQKRDLDSVPKRPRIHSPQIDVVSEEAVSGCDDGASSQPLRSIKRASPTRNEMAPDVKKRREEDVGIS